MKSTVVTPVVPTRKYTRDRWGTGTLLYFLDSHVLLCPASLKPRCVQVAGGSLLRARSGSWLNDRNYGNPIPSMLLWGKHVIWFRIMTPVGTRCSEGWLIWRERQSPLTWRGSHVRRSPPSFCLMSPCEAMALGTTAALWHPARESQEQLRC